MSSWIALAASVWGVAVVLAAPLLAAVWADSRRGLVGDEETGFDGRENELVW